MPALCAIRQHSTANTGQGLQQLLALAPKMAAASHDEPSLSLLSSPYLSLALSLPLLLLLTGGPRNLLSFLVELATNRCTHLLLCVGVLFLSLSGMPHVVATGSPPLALNPRTRRAEFIAPSGHAQYGLEGLVAGALHVLAAGCVVLAVEFLPAGAAAVDDGVAGGAEERKSSTPGPAAGGGGGGPVREGPRRRPSRETVLLVAACLFAASIAALVAMFRRKNGTSLGTETLWPRCGAANGGAHSPPPSSPVPPSPPTPSLTLPVSALQRGTSPSGTCLTTAGSDERCGARVSVCTHGRCCCCCCWSRS